MLLEYENINRLLGPTDDDTGPGTHCEILLRDFLRRNLPPRYSLNKGFILGRRLKGGEEVHSPEIDILIHDTDLYTPIFKLEDFVIVAPHAVRGIIQVKRTLTSGQLKNAISNVIDAKEHLRDCALPGYPQPQLDRVFSGCVFFNDTVERPKGGGVSRTYRQRLQRTGISNDLRPDFAGSLSFRYYLRLGLNRDTYSGQSSEFTKNDVNYNAALVGLLGLLAYVILPPGTHPPVYYPPGYAPDETFMTEPDQQVANPAPAPAD